MFCLSILKYVNYPIPIANVLLSVRNYSKMSVFIQKLNPLTGVNDWEVRNEDYDYHQEVARAAFADMLHDTERNQLYEKALKSAIEKMHDNGKKANVLDIGTGTGLLSMMAVRNGADSVTACEAFKPMSQCALNIIKLNGMQNKITVIPKRSTELTVEENGDVKEKFNILVTEVFDTELIGEGALSTFNHAHKYLLEKDCIVIPQSATIFAQVVECPIVHGWNKLRNIFDDDGDLLIQIPDSIRNCPGSASVHDIQLSQLPQNCINTIVSPTPVLRFDWSGKTPFIYERSTINAVKCERDGKAQAVFMWWELQMDTDNKLLLSCAPIWAHPWTKNNDKVDIPWRDHWMQAVYYFPKEIPVKKGQEVNLLSSHDEYSLWFNLCTNLKISSLDYLNPVCQCGLHVAFSRTRIGQMNDMKRNKIYLRLFEKHIDSDSTVLVLSDGFYVSLACCKFGARKVYIVDTNPTSRRILNEIITTNHLKNVEIIEDIQKLAQIQLGETNFVIAEPYFSSSIVPWDNILFLYLLKGIKKFLPANAQIFPRTAIIKAIAVKFDHLHKIRSALGSCEGFLMKDFDDLIQNSMNISDDIVEAQPLWEYPGIALSEEIEIANVDLSNPEPVYKKDGSFVIDEDTDCNGIALWVDWNFGKSENNYVSTGPLSNTEVGKYIQWDMHTRQGVCLFPSVRTRNIKFHFKFDAEKGSIAFKHFL